MPEPLISTKEAEDAVNLLNRHAIQNRDSVSIFRDQEGIPMAIVTACDHCAKLFDEFAQLSDDQKEAALRAVRSIQ